MARRKAKDEEFEDEYEEEYTGGSFIDAFSSASWRRIFVLPLILILFGFGSWMLWKKYRDDVLNHASYKLDAKSIKYTPEPEWLKRDILDEVVKLGSLESKKSHETGLTVQVRGAFVHHPWVKEVERVRIHYPAKLEVVLTYRKPVAMVALPDDDPDDGEAWILPIDADAVLLPSRDFSPEFAQTFPRINVGNTKPVGRDGASWGDPVVADAAKLAELLYAEWESLKDVLYQIQLNSRPTSTGTAADFDIRGRSGVGPEGHDLLIHWGRAPGKEQASEPTAKAKFEALRDWVNDARINGLPIDEIDLRTVRLIQAFKPGSMSR